MPVCLGCGASYTEAEARCPYCGRVKPEKPKVIIQQAHSETDSDLACPHCGRTDAAAKVSAIVTSQTQTVQMQTTRGAAVSAAQSTALAQRLASFPPKPSESSADTRMVLLGLISLMMFVCALAFLCAAVSDKEMQDSIVDFLFWAFLSGTGAWFFLHESNPPSRRAKHAAAQRTYTLYMALWERLWYCSRCDVVYFPGEARWETPENLRAWLLGKIQSNSAKT